uniref:Uncharacterized protein n=1 Tax=Arundo donax TaxID=35708 RepID=A0A0A9F0T4_ARUDO
MPQLLNCLNMFQDDSVNVLSHICMDLSGKEAEKFHSMVRRVHHDIAGQ